MSQFERLDIKYTPLDIESNLINSNSVNAPSSSDVTNIAVADKLLTHLSMIQAYRDRVSAIDYLIEGAAKLAGNPIYVTHDKSIISDIATLNGKDNVVDFDLFKKAVDIVVNGYEQLALIGITGVANQ